MTTRAHAFPDHFPTCPHCGNLCGRLARICADCGGFLYEPELNDRIVRERMLGIPRNVGRRTTPGRAPEDTQPTKGKVT